MAAGAPSDENRSKQRTPLRMKQWRVGRGSWPVTRVRATRPGRGRPSKPTSRSPLTGGGAEEDPREDAPEIAGRMPTLQHNGTTTKGRYKPIFRM